ncbi:alkaline phosphatase family protein [Wenzhouxiangella marina]|uniref:Ectonucleotide pyrophosphatase/phosphodiesterase family member 1/3 n=1 Tax=Wenzhouxiangella marina TaxID=1579979 RepID=A0A0K0Y0H8_9GAMM|nr:ectonucleotide pyrophosphatase/phosphodiesterase [Wenzhouxiangella marina]AKS43371.1 Ectonucleotide pyrophosphatase/phosphodiesterase family member 1/3 [Wenzhouxiangella marina]MBB6088513.1 putative AlkP superfamily pyrophosphatase or phosphodiesterase [Wenzhouxiangella marina]
MTPRVLPLLVALLVTACSSQSAPEARPAPLLLISIDGLRHDYIDLTDTPALDRLIAGGLKADGLQQVFPSKTFPTHYSLVTGRHPGSHGVVGNNMWDPARDSRFRLSDREAVSDGYWYQGGEPIWVTAQRQGLSAATYFWPGSEARIHRVRPDHWKPYAGDTPHAERIEQLLAWFDLPIAERPDLFTLYFHAVDSAGHDDGPASLEALTALSEIDGHLGRLLDGLEARGLLGRTHILLVSDHGMAEIDHDRYLFLDDYLDLSGLIVSDAGPAAQIWAIETPAEDIVAALRNAHPRLRVWAREDIPERYQFGPHARVPDVLAEADPGWMIHRRRAERAQRSPNDPRGMHGWDPAFRDMHGVFLAHGPTFAAGSRAPTVRSVDLYALMSHLLGIDPAEHQGSLRPFKPYFDAAPLTPAHRSLRCDGAAPMQVELAPNHLSLKHGLHGYVLLREFGDDSAARFAAPGLKLEWRGEQASLKIDEQRFEDCRLEPTAH